MIKNKLIIVLLTKVLFCFSLNSSFANPCTQAIETITQKQPIPKDVLTAVALTETGTAKKGKLEPYPWAINVQGKGFLFATKQQAITAAKMYLAQGITSFDVGCMQLNWYWHKDKFDNVLEKAFDPHTNITVGANYILEHYQTYKNWHKAVGRYHSGTEKFAKIYREKYAVNLKIAQNQNTFAHNNVLLDDNPVKNVLNMLMKTAGSLISFQENTEKTVALIDMSKKSLPIIDTRRKKSAFTALH